MLSVYDARSFYAHDPVGSVEAYPESSALSTYKTCICHFGETLEQYLDLLRDTPWRPVTAHDSPHWIQEAGAGTGKPSTDDMIFTLGRMATVDGVHIYITPDRARPPTLIPHHVLIKAHEARPTVDYTDLRLRTLAFDVFDQKLARWFIVPRVRFPSTYHFEPRTRVPPIESVLHLPCDEPLDERLGADVAVGGWLLYDGRPPHILHQSVATTRCVWHHIGPYHDHRGLAVSDLHFVLSMESIASYIIYGCAISGCALHIPAKIRLTEEEWSDFIARSQQLIRESAALPENQRPWRAFALALTFTMYQRMNDRSTAAVGSYAYTSYRSMMDASIGDAMYKLCQRAQDREQHHFMQWFVDAMHVRFVGRGEVAEETKRDARMLLTAVQFMSLDRFMDRRWPAIFDACYAMNPSWRQRVL